MRSARACGLRARALTCIRYLTASSLLGCYSLLVQKDWLLVDAR